MTIVSSGQLTPPPVFQAFGTNGQFLAGGLLYTYAAGTSSPIAVYQDFALLQPWTNPVVLNALGQAQIWLTPGQAYKFLLTDSSGNTLPGYPVDQITVNSPTALTAQLIGSLLYPQTASEVAAGVTPTYYYYPPGDIRRYGADPTGVSPSDSAMVQALASNAEVFIAPGTYLSNNQTIVYPRKTLYGLGREGAIWNYSGTLSAFLVINQSSGSTSVPNASGYGLNNFYGFTIALTNALNNNACLEINACGFAYYSVHDMRLTGTGGKWTLILDGVEICRVYSNIIEACGATAGTSTVSAAIWLTCGPDRTGGQRQGYTNNVTIQDNQLNNAYYGILDDGGSCHNYIGNNINGSMIPVRFSNVQGLLFTGHEIENVYTTYYGIANIYFYDQTLSGLVTPPDTMPPSYAPYGAVKAATIFDNFFGANLAPGSETINFSASVITTFHTVDLYENTFRFNAGVVATLYVTQAGGCRFWNNYDTALGSVPHYLGLHIDANGCDYGEPALGSTCGFSQGTRIYGRTSYPHQFAGGAVIGSNGTTLTTKIKGTVAMAGTTQAVLFSSSLTGSSYQVSLCGNGNGGPFWANARSPAGFTINANSTFTGSVDWIVEL